MKKNPMVLLPIFLVAVLGAYFGYKWWHARTMPIQTQQISDSGAVDDRGQSLLKNFKMDDQNAVQLKPVNPDDTSYGVVHLAEDGDSFTVAASLPKLTKGWYQVWVTANNITENMGTLKLEKGGYLLDYEHGTTLPSSFTLTVTKELKNDKVMEQKLLEGEVSAHK